MKVAAQDIELDIIVYEQPGGPGFCMESFSRRGERFLSNIQRIITCCGCTAREALEDSGLRYEVVTKPH